MWLLYSLVLSMFGLGKVMKCSNAFFNPITSSLLPLHWQKENSTNVEFSALLLVCVQPKVFFWLFFFDFATGFDYHTLFDYFWFLAVWFCNSFFWIKNLKTISYFNSLSSLSINSNNAQTFATTNFASACSKTLLTCAKEWSFLTEL